MNIGEAPGADEDAVGKPFQGKTGRALQRMYKSLGVDLFEDCINVNACHCYPTDEDGTGRTPTNDEVANCRRRTLEAVREYKPKVIVALGNAAVFSLIGHRWKKDLGGITKWRGYTIPDQDIGTWLCPTFHPSYVERMNADEVRAVWKQDLQQAINIRGEFPVYSEPKIEYLHDLKVLDGIKDGATVTIDYETTGLKPHATGHRIICASVATSPDHVYAFFMPNTPQERRPFVNMLANPKIGKMAHNMKFEEAWSMVRMHQPVQNWVWDSMLAAHVLDNRPGVTGLKFQAYVQFGIVDYSSDIDPYLKATDDSNANAINRIYELLDKPGGREKLLHYCALDSVYEYRLAVKQQSEIELPF